MTMSQKLFGLITIILFIAGSGFAGDANAAPGTNTITPPKPQGDRLEPQSRRVCDPWLVVVDSKDVGGYACRLQDISFAKCNFGALLLGDPRVEIASGQQRVQRIYNCGPSKFDGKIYPNPCPEDFSMVGDSSKGVECRKPNGNVCGNSFKRMGNSKVSLRSGDKVGCR